jgi:hypothetical protein
MCRGFKLRNLTFQCFQLLACCIACLLRFITLPYSLLHSHLQSIRRSVTIFGNCRSDSLQVLGWRSTFICRIALSLLVFVVKGSLFIGSRLPCIFVLSDLYYIF